MCGIAGFIHRRLTGSETMRVAISTMTNALSHRGPDDSGTWIDLKAGVALGHRRLSIRDLSPLGHQPMLSHCERFVIAFNGEIYNHREIRKDLIARGVQFRGNSDTEVLAAAIACWGPRETASRCNGMFAVAAWDRVERVLHLLRDRVGEKPLYYGWIGTGFVFASELKAIRSYPGVACTINPEALFQYLKRGYIPAPLSIYQDIYKLPAGTHLQIRSGTRVAAPEPYWSLDDALGRAAANPFRASESEAVQRLEKLLLDAVGMRMQSDVPLGAMLSGGIDSSTVVALMQAQSTAPVKTFTIGFESEPFNEAHHAAAVAQHLGTDHTELLVRSREALDVIPKLTYIYDEPFADSSQIPTCLVSELAKRHVTVALSGDGGDEVFGGYDRYRWAGKLWNFRESTPLAVRRLGIAGLEIIKGLGLFTNDSALQRQLAGKLRIRNLTDKAERLAAVLGRDTAVGMYDALTSVWPDPSSVLLRDMSHAPSLAFEFIKGWSLTEQMMYTDTLCYLPDDILAKIDRASMSVALETRVPILDHRVIEFSWSLPAELRLHASRSKPLLRKILDHYVPPDLMDRPKTGFAVPLGEWLKGELRPWAESLLSETQLRQGGLLDPACIRKRWAEHISGKRDHSHQIWSILMFQDWLRQTAPEHDYGASPEKSHEDETAELIA